MLEFVLRIKFKDGSFADLPFRAVSSGMAIKIAEAQFGPGCFMGVISQSQ